MDKRLKEYLFRIDKKTQNAVTEGRVNGSPFVEFTNHAGAIFSGFEVLIDLLQVNQLKAGHGDDDALNEYESGAIMSMMRASCNVMANRVEDLAEWARDRIKEGAE